MKKKKRERGNPRGGQSQKKNKILKTPINGFCKVNVESVMSIGQSPKTSFTWE